MEIFTLFLVWLLFGGVLAIINFLLFRFSIIRKLVSIFASIMMILTAVAVNDVMSRPANSYESDSAFILLVTTSFFLMLVLLMAYGDSLLDTEVGTEYRGEVSRSFLGNYYLSVSETPYEKGVFFRCYVVVTIAAALIWFICFNLLKWDWIYIAIGTVNLVYIILLKPLFIKYKIIN